MNKVYASMDEAVADIPDGASILVGGFGPGSPINLIPALYRRGAKDLTIISNSTGGGLIRARPDLISVETLVEQGRVRKVVMSFTGATHPSRPAILEELQQTGKIEAVIVPQGTLAEQIRAGGSGIPAFYTPAGVGTEVAVGKEQRDFDGRTYLLEHAITADYAFVRAWKADSFGNLVFRFAQRNFNPIMAMAARCTIVEVEEPVLPEGGIDPDHVHTPGVFVHRVVPIPADGLLHVRFGAQVQS